MPILDCSDSAFWMCIFDKLHLSNNVISIHIMRCAHCVPITAIGFYLNFYSITFRNVIKHLLYDLSRMASLVIFMLLSPFLEVQVTS